MLELPVPSHPSPGVRSEEEFGLALLELSLGLRHITRQSEHLKILDKSHMDRSVTLDVDLYALSDRQRKIISGPLRESDDVGDLAWVPIARQNRKDLSPVAIHDAQGNVVSRLTHHETTRYVSSALTHLFHMLLDANPMAQHPNHDLYNLRHRWHGERWLIETAIASLIDDGPLDFDVMNKHKNHALRYSTTAPTDPPEGSSLLVRGRAIRCLETLLERDGESFVALLDWATHEYPIVVLISSLQTKCFLSYEAPLLRDGNFKKVFAPGWRSLRTIVAPNRLFTVRYDRVSCRLFMNLTTTPGSSVRVTSFGTTRSLSDVQDL
jgi:hypothetical protein